MHVTVNGDGRTVPEPLNVGQLVGFLELKKERVAVELNQALVPRASWDDTFLKSGDAVEIVHFVGGG